jgi:hypothetical protein
MDIENLVYRNRDDLFNTKKRPVWAAVFRLGLTRVDIGHASLALKAKSMQTRVYRYGLPGLQIKALFEERNGLCVLCDRKATDVDHDHKTGRVRGVLCTGCSSAMSRVEIEGWAAAALKFLERGKSKCSSQQLELPL